MRNPFKKVHDITVTYNTLKKSKVMSYKMVPEKGKTNVFIIALDPYRNIRVEIN